MGSINLYLLWCSIFNGGRFHASQSLPLSLLLFTFFVPVGAEVLISLKRPIVATQTLIWASVPYYVLIAKGVVALRNKWAVCIGIALLTVFSSLALYKYYTQFEKERWDLAAQFVSENLDKK